MKPFPQDPAGVCTQVSEAAKNRADDRRTSDTAWICRLSHTETLSIIAGHGFPSSFCLIQPHTRFLQERKPQKATMNPLPKGKTDFSKEAPGLINPQISPTLASPALARSRFTVSPPVGPSRHLPTGGFLPTGGSPWTSTCMRDKSNLPCGLPLRIKWHHL